MNAPFPAVTKWRRRAILSAILNILFICFFVRLAKHVPLMRITCESHDLAELNAIIEDGTFLQAVPLSSDKRFRSGWIFPIHWAAAAANPDAVRLFLEAHVDPNTLSSEGQPPVFWLLGLSEQGKEESVRECLRLLISHGADINRREFKDYPGYSVLHFSARFLSPKDVALLCEFGADVNSRDSHGNSPLHLAVAEGTGAAEQRDWESTLKELVRRGADIEMKNSDGDMPIDVAGKTKRGFPISNEITALLTPR